MKTFRNITLIALAAAAVTVPAPASAATVRQFEGTITSVDRDSRTFKIRDSERGTFRVRVTSRTRWERINGLAGLRRGMTNIETTVRRSNRRWVAIEVERSGGGGEHGGRGGDDSSAGDDSGGRGGRGGDDS
jgi:hypothetical protein